jgi:hypothetical protein
MKKIIFGLITVFAVSLFVANQSHAGLLKGSGLNVNAETDTNVLNINCFNGDDSEPCSSYTTTNHGKIGSIKVNINGTSGYIDVKRGPS